MSITKMRDFEGEDREMEYVYMVGQGNSNCFGRSKGPPFYEPFPTREMKNKARQAFGPYCLNCGIAEHTLARECPEGYINKPGLIHHSMGEGRRSKYVRSGRGSNAASARILPITILGRNEDATVKSWPLYR